MTPLLSAGLLAACGGGEPPSSPAPGKADGFGAAGVVVINEVAPNPEIDINGDGRINTGDEYIELVNPTDGDADLTGVTIEDTVGERFRFPDGAVLKAGSAAVVLARVENFEAPEGVDVYRAGRLGLNNDGDNVRLRRDGQLIGNHGYSMGDSRGTWNRTPEGDPEAALFQIQDPTPGLRADGSAFGSNLIAPNDSQALLLGLHDECPDTFCGGDFSFFFDMVTEATLECTGDGNCTITGQATPFQDEQWVAGSVAALSESEKTSTSGNIRARLTGEVTRDASFADGKTFVEFACDLKGGYYASFQVVDGDDLSDDLRDQFLDCISELESGLFSNLGITQNLLTSTESQNILSALDNECPDTFCGGDFNYFLADDDGELVCADETCTIEFTAFPFEGQWASDALETASVASLTATMPDATLEAISMGGSSSNPSVRLRCELPGFEVAEEVYDVTTDQHTTDFDIRFGDCVDLAEDVLITLDVDN